MITLGTTFGGAYLAMRGGKKLDEKAKGPPINAGSKDEEKFIKYVYTKGRIPH
jgi:F-type H+-transporting ATPase subunit k